MTWAKFDDRYHDHPKVNAAWSIEPASVGLHAMAITYSALHETDGLVPASWIEQKLPSKPRRQKAVNALVATGLFEVVGDGRYVVHDYLDFNPSSAHLIERRRKDSARKRSQAAAGIRTESNGNPDGFREGSARNPRDSSRASARAPGRVGPGQETEGLK